VKRPVTKSGERGFALLIVFLLAAAIALMLYQQMPRVAFESERDKEQLLIDRGEQYKRAIYLYMQANKRYPARMEDLENTNDKRFLRKRYIDPFTGKNEWRLVHTNGMFLTDSLVQKPPAAPGDDKNKDTSTTASNTTTGANGVPGTTPPPDVNATVFQRPSDRTLPNGLPGQFNPAQPIGQQPGDPNQIGIGPGQMAFPPITLTQLQGTGQPGANGQPGQPLPPGVAPNSVPGSIQPGLPGGAPFQFPIPTGTGQPPVPGTDPSQGQPVQGPFGQPNQGQFGQPNQGQFGQPGQGQGQPGTVQGGIAGPPNTALGMINTLLTTPRTPPAGIGVPTSNNTVGGGIAGVASTYEGPSIKSYNTRTKFNEWEFVFQNQPQGAPGQTTPPPNGQPPGQPNNTGAGPTGNAPPPAQ
jgi:hypothetical protein